MRNVLWWLGFIFLYCPVFCAYCAWAWVAERYGKDSSTETRK